MIQITQYEGQHPKERDAKELCELLKFAEDNDIDIDIEPPKEYNGYSELKNGHRSLL